MIVLLYYTISNIQGGESGSFGRLNNCGGGEGERLESAPGSPVHVPRSVFVFVFVCVSVFLWVYVCVCFCVGVFYISSTQEQVEGEAGSSGSAGHQWSSSWQWMAAVRYQNEKISWLVWKFISKFFEVSKLDAGDPEQPQHPLITNKNIVWKFDSKFFEDSKLDAGDPE